MNNMVSMFHVSAQSILNFMKYRKTRSIARRIILKEKILIDNLIMNVNNNLFTINMKTLNLMYLINNIYIHIYIKYHKQKQKHDIE